MGDLVELSFLAPQCFEVLVDVLGRELGKNKSKTICDAILTESFIQHQLWMGNEILVRDPKTGEVQTLRFGDD